MPAALSRRRRWHHVAVTPPSTVLAMLTTVKRYRHTNSPPARVCWRTACLLDAKGWIAESDLVSAARRNAAPRAAGWRRAPLRTWSDSRHNGALATNSGVGVGGASQSTTRAPIHGFPKASVMTHHRYSAGAGRLRVGWGRIRVPTRSTARRQTQQRVNGRGVVGDQSWGDPGAG